MRGHKLSYCDFACCVSDIPEFLRIWEGGGAKTIKGISSAASGKLSYSFPILPISVTYSLRAREHLATKQGPSQKALSFTLRKIGLDVSTMSRTEEPASMDIPSRIEQNNEVPPLSMLRVERE